MFQNSSSQISQSSLFQKLPFLFFLLLKILYVNISNLDRLNQMVIFLCSHILVSQVTENHVLSIFSKLYITFQNNQICMSQQREEDKKARRSSKIPLSLKNAFLTTFMEEKLSIKKAATRFGINYSTAKAIIKDNHKFIKGRMKDSSQSEFMPENMVKKDKKGQGNEKFVQCGYIYTPNMMQMEKLPHISKVIIVSTVAWDFLSDGVPKLQ